MANETESNGAVLVHGEELRPRPRALTERGVHRTVGIPAPDSGRATGNLTRYACSTCGLERDERRHDWACWLPGCPGTMIERAAQIDTVPIPSFCPHGVLHADKLDNCQPCALHEQARTHLVVALVLNLVTCSLVLLLLVRVWQ